MEQPSLYALRELAVLYTDIFSNRLVTYLQDIRANSEVPKANKSDKSFTTAIYINILWQFLAYFPSSREKLGLWDHHAE
jgi:hypothetical protein